MNGKIKLNFFAEVRGRKNSLYSLVRNGVPTMRRHTKKREEAKDISAEFWGKIAHRIWERLDVSQWGRGG